MSIAAARKKYKEHQPLTVFEKRIPMNPKYAHIQSSLDTGASIKILPKILSDQQIAKRRNEVFRRLKPRRVFEVINNIQANENPESIYDMDSTQRDDAKSISSMTSLGNVSVSSACSIVEAAASGVLTSRDILLVDLRDPAEYRLSRVPYAVSHPGYLISRDQFTPALQAFKTKVKGKALVVYHCDDKQSAMYATLLIEKGWEEVWIIDGGFTEYMNSYPEAVEADN